MSWHKLLAANRVERHATTKQELEALRAMVRRNLRDAGLEGLSADNKFGLAYEAALLLGKMAIACAGYRVKGYGAHHTTFVALELVAGLGASKLASYFDRCRRKRNDLSYDAADIVSEAEADELLRAVGHFRKTIEAWIAQRHPQVST